jgi:hypothetical protein
MTTIKIIYNNCYGGGFAFSTAFETEYRARTGGILATHRRLLDPRSPTNIRIDSVAIGILEEKGSEWSSGANASLDIREIPTVFATYWSIDEKDGDETVECNTESALADLLHTYMKYGDSGVLTDGYRHIMAEIGRLYDDASHGSS